MTFQWRSLEHVFEPVSLGHVYVAQLLTISPPVIQTPETSDGDGIPKPERSGVSSIDIPTPNKSGVSSKTAALVGDARSCSGTSIVSRFSNAAHK